METTHEEVLLHAENLGFWEDEENENEDNNVVYLYQETPDGILIGLRIDTVDNVVTTYALEHDITWTYEDFMEVRSIYLTQILNYD